MTKPDGGGRRRPTTTAPRLAARVLTRAIGWYQAWSATRLPRCRFMPSCAEYTKEAIVRRGAFRGTWAGARRLARCRPGGGMGFDPVEPEGA